MQCAVTLTAVTLSIATLSIIKLYVVRPSLEILCVIMSSVVMLPGGIKLC
jgi:hypothetical protein